MRTSTFGVGIAILGILVFSYPDINFITEKKTVDIGPVKMDKEEGHLAQWQRVTGVVLVLGGIAFTLKGRRRPI